MYTLDSKSFAAFPSLRYRESPNPNITLSSWDLKRSFFIFLRTLFPINSSAAFVCIKLRAERWTRLQAELSHIHLNNSNSLQHAWFTQGREQGKLSGSGAIQGQSRLHFVDKHQTLVSAGLRINKLLPSCSPRQWFSSFPSPSQQIKFVPWYFQVSHVLIPMALREMIV